MSKKHRKIDKVNQENKKLTNKKVSITNFCFRHFDSQESGLSGRYLSRYHSKVLLSDDDARLEEHCVADTCVFVCIICTGSRILYKLIRKTKSTFFLR
jgi:hypothetical protein